MLREKNEQSQMVGDDRSLCIEDEITGGGVKSRIKKKEVPAKTQRESKCLAKARTRQLSYRERGCRAKPCPQVRYLSKISTLGLCTLLPSAKWQLGGRGIRVGRVGLPPPRGHMGVSIKLKGFGRGQGTKYFVHLILIDSFRCLLTIDLVN